ncbi:two-component system response regulator VfmH [Dickeya fangzhongdai]|uniref:two-component system response regulator VfmH n=1 Tax=Dickeya fangzhongdai TaxID=1778540 RepID=UPI0023E389BE|nr:two-component system response regulator VfmH [Dickeya fangzhongdai]WES90338.1 two-component system response regulator VfmH [Dickeya fangzhongdai]
MADKQHILIVDDDAHILASLQMLLSMEGYRVTLASAVEQVPVQLSQHDFDLILMDMNYQRDTTSGQEGLVLLEEIKRYDEYLPVVAMTGWGSVDIAVSAMQAGAVDFIQKPWDNERLLNVIRQQISFSLSQRSGKRLKEENKLLKLELEDNFNGEWVVESAPMKQLMRVVEQVAATETNILILGENGTGKSLLARVIHQLSPRRDENMVSVNMGCINENLFESEMFGHVKGAFTDARESRVGRFELADKGTLFLDEIGNLPMTQQSKLLRILEERCFERVGSSRTLKTNCRIIAATNAELDVRVAEGTFRQDLYYRLNTIELRVPSLVERQQDIMPLALNFIDRYARKYNKPAPGLSQSGQAALSSYHWPGNIRELSHLLERAVLLCGASRLNSDDIFPSLPGAPQKVVKAEPELVVSDATLADIEERLLCQRMAKFEGNAIKAAHSLGLSRSAFYRRLEKYKINHE